MPRVFRQQYTRAIPSDAVPTIIKHRKTGKDIPAVRFKDADGKAVVAPLTKNGDRCRVPSPTWYGKVGGKPVALCSNKTAAEVMLADLVRKAQHRKAGMADPFEGHNKRLLDDHLADYR